MKRPVALCWRSSRKAGKENDKSRSRLNTNGRLAGVFVTKREKVVPVALVPQATNLSVQIHNSRGEPPSTP